MRPKRVQKTGQLLFKSKSILAFTGHPSRETFPRLPPQILSPQNTKVKQTSGRSMFLGKDLITHKLWYFGSVSGRPPPIFSYWFQVWKETVSPMAGISGRKKEKESWTHHILIIVAIFFRHSCVWVTVPNGEFHRAAESTSNWGGKGKPLQVSSAVSSAWAFASQKGLRRK